MPNSQAYYSTLLELNGVSFAQKLYLVSYHALCGALYCAFDLQDKARVIEVQELAADQLQRIQSQLNAHDSGSEPLEVTLYTSLTRIAHPTHMYGFKSPVTRL